jgi:hypothetical protein
MKDQFELLDELFKMRDEFDQDPEVMELIFKLKSKLKQLESETFSKKELKSEEFVEMCDMSYQELRELDPDEFSVFDIIWLMDC